MALISKVVVVDASSSAVYVTKVHTCRVVLKYLGTNRWPNIQS